MAVLNGFAGSAIGASGSTNALEGKSGWFVYICPRGAYASAASTGTNISVDSNDERDRYAVNDWIQIGTDTGKIRQVTSVATLNTITINTAVNVSQNDRILLIGATQPTVSGGSASYQPNTTTYARDNDTGTPITDSKLTTDSSGNYRFHAADAFYDLLAQDTNQSNQLILPTVPVGLATSGNLIADGVNTRDLGSSGVPWKDIHYAGSIINGISDGSGTTMFDFRNATGLTQGNLFEFSLNDSTKISGDTYGGIHDSWSIPRVVNVKSARFGAKGDNSTIDTTAIADGITFAKTLVSGSQGAQVYFPKGTYLIDSTLVFPEGVEPVGEGSRSTFIKADSTFPTTGEPLIRIGDGSDGDIHSVLIRDLALDCNQIAGTMGVYSDEANEEAGIMNCVIFNYESAGVFWDGASNQNTRILNSTFAHTNATATGISLNSCGARNLISDVTVTSNNATQSTSAGIGVTNCHVTIISAHLEFHDTGIWYGKNSTGTIIGADGNSTIDNLILLDQEGCVVLACSPNGATNLVADNANGVTLTSDTSLQNSGGWYMSSNDVAVGGTRSIWTSGTEGTNQVNPPTVFGGTVSWGAQRMYQTTGLMTGPPFESVAAAGTITISRNRVKLTGGAQTISTINPITSDMEGTEILIQNAESGDKTFDENGNVEATGGVSVVLTLGDVVRFCAIGTTWYQSSNRQDH